MSALYPEMRSDSFFHFKSFSKYKIKNAKFHVQSYSKYKIAGFGSVYNVLYPDMRFEKQPLKMSPTTPYLEHVDKINFIDWIFEISEIP